MTLLQNVLPETHEVRFAAKFPSEQEQTLFLHSTGPDTDSQSVWPLQFEPMTGNEGVGTVVGVIGADVVTVVTGVVAVVSGNVTVGLGDGVVVPLSADVVVGAFVGGAGAVVVDSSAAFVVVVVLGVLSGINGGVSVVAAFVFSVMFWDMSIFCVIVLTTCTWEAIVEIKE